MHRRHQNIGSVIKNNDDEYNRCLLWLDDNLKSPAGLGCSGRNLLAEAMSHLAGMI